MKLFQCKITKKSAENHVCCSKTFSMHEYINPSKQKILVKKQLKTIGIEMQLYANRFKVFTSIGDLRFPIDVGQSR
eukprot:UN23842